MKKAFRFIFSRLFLTSVFLAIQLAVIIIAIFTLSTSSVAMLALLYIISQLFAVFIAAGDKNPSFRIAWLIPITVMPIFGWLFYFVFSYAKPFKKNIENLKESENRIKKIRPKSDNSLTDLNLSSAAKRELNYLEDIIGSQIRLNTQTQFFKRGEDFFAELLKRLENAQDFIFIEYFIIKNGFMWDSILSILKRKAKSGVDVRILYDDLGTINLLPGNYCRILSQYGIKACVFNRYRATLDSFLSSRDHRKITVIDGMCAFTGGINLSDEYINKVTLHGHWKDCAIMLCGDAVDDLCAGFLTLWNFANKTAVSDIDKTFFKAQKQSSDGVVACFEDSPCDDRTIGRDLFLNLIGSAQNSVYICTPYLIPDSELMNALQLSAQSGVKVKIITPHIPDKKWVHDVTRSNYDMLIECGVEIFEYTKGFVHSKMICTDNDNAVVSTVNLDFRSLYLHFENGVYMYKSKAVTQVRQDFEELFESCEKIRLNQFYSKNPFVILKTKLLRLFSPLM